MGLTQAEVAKRIGVNRRALHEWEAGTWQPHRAIPQLAEVYEVTPSFLLFGVESASVELQQLREQVMVIVEEAQSFQAETAQTLAAIQASLVGLGEATASTLDALLRLAEARLDDA